MKTFENALKQLEKAAKLINLDENFLKKLKAVSV